MGAAISRRFVLENVLVTFPNTTVDAPAWYFVEPEGLRLNRLLAEGFDETSMWTYEASARRYWYHIGAHNVVAAELEFVAE